MRKVIVTGGSRGIGLAIARRLAASGYGVVAVARRESDELKRAAEAAQDDAGAIDFAAFDLGDIDGLADFAKSLRKQFGSIWGLVNNAGIGTEGVLATMHNSQIETLLRINVTSPIVLTKYIVRQMMADGGGRVINMSSIIGSTGYNGLSVYGATKAAALGFTRSLAREVGRLNITVNAIAPGFIDTELTSGLAGEGRDKIANRSAYNIATPLLIGWLCTEPWPPWYDAMVLMFQREVAQRIVAREDDDAYGRLAVLSNWRAETQMLFDIAPSAFVPPPKVTSSVVRLVPRANPLACDRSALEQVAAAAFGQRRKMLRQSLKSLGVDPARLAAAAGIDPARRAETVPVAGFVAMANELIDIRNTTTIAWKGEPAMTQMRRQSLVKF
ncbi:SDR family NAD(P)-dependent oxidoreductase, partial [Rhodopseudomonas sp. B29]|uniref:SDR family NAD(P)-dependent oxidoreductase n=1 Tax=Rhodopseudomonas sp. B29 TaxID=95607 RepID=UPI0035E3C86B